VLLVLALARRKLPQVTAVSAPGSLPWLALLRDPGLRAALTVSVLGPASYEVFLFVMPLQGTRIGLSASTIGSILGASAVAIFMVRLLMPALVRWLREWSMMAAVFVLLSASYLLLAVVTQTWILFMIGILMGIAQGIGQPVLMSMYFAASPDGRKGEAAGLRGVLQNAFSTFSPVFMGGLGTLLGIGPVLVAASCVCAWAAWYSRRRRFA
jgi:predicted MFS family arabinose efflux permease